MECERLKRLIKNWYLQVQDEAMAPARMVDFMRKHVDECSTCLADQIVELEIKRITEIVLPPSKIPKALRRAEAKKDDTDADADGDATNDTKDTAETDEHKDTEEDAADGEDTAETDEHEDTEEDADDADLDPDDEDDEI
jgi:hypothetical protein